MNMLSRAGQVLAALLISAPLFAQQTNGDLALNHNRLLREKTGEGVYVQVGNFKVTGTSYLFGVKNKGNLFSAEAKAYNIFLSYNTFNQEVEFYSSSNPDKPLIKEPGDVDSFTILPNIEIGLNQPLMFVYGPLIGSSEKAYFQEVYTGPKYSVYKRYKSDLGIVSTNYVQSELRQFDLTFDYFYADNAKKSVRKIKPNNSNVVKEFKSVKDLSGIVSNDAFSNSPDEAFKKVFEILNQ